VNDAALAPRITLGRALRLDQKVERDPTRRFAQRCVLFGPLAILLPCLAGSLLFKPENRGIVAAYFGMFAAPPILLELSNRWKSSYELQLLPYGVRHSVWGLTTELIEPEIVGGRWLRWTQKIRLRAGNQEASISLLNFSHRGDRAAIIEHCSQFLSPQQQAEFGREWSKAYYEIITPPKLNVLRTLAICGAFYVLGCCFVIAITECILWRFPDAILRTGGSLRTSYLGLALLPVGLAALIGLLTAIHWLEKGFGTRRKRFGPE
jgi:hypothetical protein